MRNENEPSGMARRGFLAAGLAATGPFAPPADFGFSDLGTLSHEFFRTLSMTLDFTQMSIALTIGA
jgi:hypothetical protein